MKPRPISAVPDSDKTRDQLLTELHEMRALNADLEEDKARAERQETTACTGEDMARRLMEQTLYGVWVNVCGNIAYINDVGARILGASDSGEVMGKSVLGEIIHPDYRNIVRDRIEAMNHGDSTVPVVEEKYLRVDGSVVDVDVWAMNFVYEGEPAILVAFRDISERKRTDGALRESEEKFRALTETSPAMVFFHQGGKHLYVNPAAEAITGFSPDELLNMDFWMLVAPEYRDDVKAGGLARLQGENIDTRYPVRILTRQGTEKWLEFSAAPMVYRGQPAVMVTALDVTERKHAEDALLLSQSRLEAVFESMAEGVIIFDSRGKIISINDSALKIFRYECFNAVHKSSVEYTPAYDLFDMDGRRLSEEEWPVNRALRGETFTNYEVTVKRKDVDHTRVLSYSGVPVRDQGNVGLVVLTIEDITERKQVDRALAKDRHILMKSQEVAHVGNWAYDPQTGIFTGSVENDRMFGYELDEGRKTVEWVLSHALPEDRKMVADFLDARTRDGKRGSIDYRISRPDGSIGYLNAIVDKAVRDKAGKVTKLYGITQDITGRKRIEDELKAAKLQAELYVDLMGHDINNMHQVALGYLELARDLPEGTDKAGFIDKSVEVLQRSTKLIGNVRKLQKLRDGVFQVQDIDVCRMLADVQSEFRVVPGKTIKLNLNDHEKCFVHANELLHDVFANLVGNAVKHTGHGTDIIVSMDVVEDNGRPYCRVSVEDNGPGIPDETKDRIFDRMNNGSARGSGLGLYLVKTLVDSYGGKVMAEDRMKGDYSKGARFVVMLPAIESKIYPF